MQAHTHFASLGLAVTLAMASVAVHAQSSVTLTLGNEHTGAYIENYFLGGSDSVPNDYTGPNLGFGFSSNATVQKAGFNQSTGDGRFEGNPSGQAEILYFAADNSSGVLNSGGSYVNFANGFSGLSFNYSLSANSTQFDGTADIWSGLNGTGTLLGTIALNAAATTTNCNSRNDAYCTWTATSASNFGTAESVTFGAAASTDDTEFDGLSVTPVPLPASVWMLLTGALGFLGFARAQRRTV